MPFCLMAVTPHHSQAQRHFEFPSSLITDLSRMPSYSKTSLCPLPPAPEHPFLLLPFCCPCWTSCYTFHSPAYCLLSQPSNTISLSPYSTQMETVVPMIHTPPPLPTFWALLKRVRKKGKIPSTTGQAWPPLAPCGTLMWSYSKLFPFPTWPLTPQLSLSQSTSLLHYYSCFPRE